VCVCVCSHHRKNLFLINLPKFTMNILKNSRLIKAGVLVVVAVGAWISITSACSVCDNAGQVCFWYEGPCPFPAGTQLCIQLGDCTTDEFGEPVLTYRSPQCCTGVGFGTPANVTGRISGNGLNGHTESFHWSELSPVPTTCAEAESTYTAYWTRFGYTIDAGSLSCTPATSTQPCSVCFSKGDFVACDPSHDGQRFIGFITCPGGKTFSINPISLAEAEGIGWCTTTNVFVSFPGQCPSCN